MSLSKYSGDNLAEDLMKPEVWRKTFRFLSIMELVRLREVCQTFKEEIDFLFTTQDKLGIINPWRGSIHFHLCHDPRYYVPNSLWIRLSENFKEYLPTLKSLFPSVKLLVMNFSQSSLNSRVDYKLYMEDVLDSFVYLESLAIDDRIECCDTNRSYPKLKHLFLRALDATKLVSLPSLESLRIECKFSDLKPWIENNVGRPSKWCDIWFPFSWNPDYSFLLSSLPSSLEYLQTGNFFGYSRQFKPMFPNLMEVNRLSTQKHGEDHIVQHGHTEFIDFLKDHRLTLKKVSTYLYSVDDEQLKDMLTCLVHGTHITIFPLQWLERTDLVRQFRLIGSLCRDRNLYLEIDGYTLTLSSKQFLDIIPPETQSLTQFIPYKTLNNRASFRRLILDILASPLRSIILRFDTNKKFETRLLTAIQGLPETHETILELFYAKKERFIILRKN